MPRSLVIRTTFVLGALVLGVGCAEQMVWTKSEFKQGQFTADQFDCKQKAYTMVGGYNPVNNFGALAVHAPGFFNECMQGKGYFLTPAKSLQPTDTVAWLHKNMPHKNGVWIRPDMVKSVASAIADYELCRGDLEDRTASECMESKGYALVIPEAFFEGARMDKEGRTDWEALRDKISCNAPMAEQIKTCLRGKGYVDKAPRALNTPS